ncbi:gallidermin/nisin family lantibiotic [Weissella uvarum]|uniref:gallidermin/nisin family lantibiotic n=1 Tax=Weissella uvarum TaxID=1479233 RepID=UPI00195F9679|nr:gallidermin/nisin family lantibiotic [Weissella uvarum]MBM7617389.1 gallidermin/nisin family lantibiotic [Weissella uvarum]MCM0595726.1 gallidermin/nisin family lantibiotic [Weissella uvarum]
MNNFNDFDLGMNTSSNIPEPELAYKSKSACTPGCKTGILMGCPARNFTKGCHLHISKK